MEELTRYTEHECHEKLAVELNGLVWELLSKKSRSVDDDDRMLQAAYASAFHWRYVGNDLHQQRGHWLISHVYAVLGRGEPALYHARKCLDITTTLHLVDFDKAYACEAMARAYAVVGEKEECEKYFFLAEKAGEHIKDEKDRELFLSDLATEPWYGIK